MPRTTYLFILLSYFIINNISNANLICREGRYNEKSLARTSKAQYCLLLLDLVHWTRSQKNTGFNFLAQEFVESHMDTIKGLGAAVSV